MKIEQLDELKKEVEEAVKKLLGEKLKRVILYGSCARGDFNDESDVDFAAMADVELIELENYHNDFVEVELDLSLKYDVDVSILVISENNMNKFLENVSEK